MFSSLNRRRSCLVQAQKFSHNRMTRCPEILRTPLHDHLPLQGTVALSSKHQCTMRNSKEARNIVGHNDRGSPNSSREAYEHLVNLARTYRIKPGSGFVRKNEIRVERQSASERDAFFHSTTDSGRTLRPMFFQTNHSEFEAGGFKQDI